MFVENTKMFLHLPSFQQYKCSQRIELPVAFKYAHSFGRISLENKISVA